jgi:hypothetical protein
MFFQKKEKERDHKDFKQSHTKQKIEKKIMSSKREGKKEGREKQEIRGT